MSDELHEIMDELAEEISEVVANRTDILIATDEDVLDRINILVDLIQEKFSEIQDEEEDSDTDYYGDMDEFSEDD